MVLVVFVHPDLGIGGAERLVCDAALALQSQGHDVRIYTAHHDKSHCFQETANGKLSVTSVGDWLPRHTLWRFSAFWAYVRMVYLASYLVFFSDLSPKVFICDQVSACIPILKMSHSGRVMFYCHFPDLLLTERKSILKKFYRMPLDWLEETTTGMADVVLVNSQFTKKTFHGTFRSLESINPHVLYPSLNFDSFKRMDNTDLALANTVPGEFKYLFVSINRFERKKNLNLALHALSFLRRNISSAIWSEVHLIMAGGYDPRVEENVQHYEELNRLAMELDVSSHVSFVRSFSGAQKVAFLQSALALLYTPSNEHFGIVPLEAMYMSCPVIACNSGGPLETVKHTETGYLCPASAESFAHRMHQLILEPDLKAQLGNAGHAHVVENFSPESFTRKLNEEVASVCMSQPKPSYTIVLWLLAVCSIFCALFVVIFNRFSLFL